MGRKKATPFLELGQVLETWRRTKYRSALAFFNDQKCSFSYSSYMEFERGIALPAPEQIIELAKILHQDPRTALYAWVRVQMPTAALKEEFSGKISTKLSTASAASSVTVADKTHDPHYDQHQAYGRRASDSPRETGVSPRFENTWVFNQADRKILMESPALYDLCLRLSLALPQAITWKDLGFKSQKLFAEYTSTYLQSWIDDGWLEVTATTLKLKQPHIHMPKTEGWHELRLQFLRRAVEVVAQELTHKQLEAGQAYRGVMTRSLEPHQVKRWVEKLGIFEREFLSEAYPKNPSAETCHSLILLLGPRKLKVPGGL